MSAKNIFIVSISILFFVRGVAFPVFAQESAPSASTPPAKIVNYQLPYPGMLPDNPLYFLKVIRDTLLAFFISKPLDKANFYLLQSDKNVEASYLLITQQQGEVSLAVSTFSQAQDDFHYAITQTKDAKRQGYNIKGISEKLAAAQQKHVQILHALAKQNDKKDAQEIQNELAREEIFAKEVKILER